MMGIICSWILLRAISDYWDELLRDVYGAIGCGVVGGGVECF